MTDIFAQFLIGFSMLAFMLTIAMHITRRNTTLLGCYLLQSLFLAAFLGTLAVKESDRLIIPAVLFTLIIKVILTPYFFGRLIARTKAYFTARTYLNIPLALLVIIALTLFLSRDIFAPFAMLGDSGLLPVSPYGLYLSGILISLFLIVNSRDVFAQIIGILSLENWIVFAGASLDVKHSIILELGITFDIAVWIVVAAIFIGMIERNFGSLNQSRLIHLKED